MLVLKWYLWDEPVRFCGIHPGAISLSVFKLPFLLLTLKITLRLLPQLPWTIELMRFLPATQIVHQGIWLINWTMFSSHLLAINIVILRHTCYQYTYLMVNFLCNVLKEMYIAHELYTWSSNQILLSEVHKKHLYENSPTFRKKYSGIMCPVIAW